MLITGFAREYLSTLWKQAVVTFYTVINKLPRLTMFNCRHLKRMYALFSYIASSRITYHTLLLNDSSELSDSKKRNRFKDNRYSRRIADANEYS